MKDETSQRFPKFLPDDRHFLLASIPARDGNFDISIGALDSRTTTRIMTASAAPIFAPPNWLVFARNGVFSVMSGEGYFRGGRVPWLGLFGSAAASAAMLYVAAQNVLRQDF